MLEPTLVLRSLPRQLRVYLDAGAILRVVVSPKNKHAPWFASTWGELRDCSIGDIADDPVLRVGLASFEITNAEASKLIAVLQLKDERPKAQQSEGGRSE